MDKVYVLQHVHKEPDGTEDTKFIGVYLTEEQAQAAVQRLIGQRGFREHPDGFTIDCYQLNEDHWCEGFVSWTEAVTPT